MYIFRVKLETCLLEFLGTLDDLTRLSRRIKKGRPFYQRTGSQIYLISTKKIEYVEIISKEKDD